MSKPRRQLKDWLLGYLDFTKNSEPPISYHTWTAISAIAGALQRKCYMKLGHGNIYPNLYIVLVGPSGTSRKTEALKIGRSILQDIGIPLTANRITREALVRFMKNKVCNYTDSTTGKLMFQSAITCVSGELSVFLGQRDIGLLSDLTDWYDSDSEWTYETKNMGVDKVTGVCLNLLGGTAPDWLPSMLPQEAVGGGFTSRTIFVVEERKAKIVEDPTLSAADWKIREKLVHDLEMIQTLSGEFEFDPEAWAMYKTWYRGTEEATLSGKPPIEDPRFAGYNSRRQVHVRKVAMAMSASRDDDMVITKADFTRALRLIELTEKKMGKVFTGIGKNRFAEASELIINFLGMHREKGITRSALLQRFYKDVSAWDLDQIEILLDRMHAVRRVIDPKTNDVIYYYIGPEI